MRLKFWKSQNKFNVSNRNIPINTENIIIDDSCSENISINVLKYSSNRIITSRYTIVNFVPTVLFEEFQRIANFYFLIQIIIQLMTDSPSNPATSIAPLIFVLVVSMVKQGYEDVIRHRADREENSIKHDKLLSDGSSLTVTSESICVGDVIKLDDGDQIPADMVLLWSSDETTGNCTVTTANLDGETSLTTIKSSSESHALVHADTCLWNCASRKRMSVFCSCPEESLRSFRGNLAVIDDVQQRPDNVRRIPLNVSNLLMRGAVLKNTDSVVGCVVYTGTDTKLSLNSKERKPKHSQVERQLNIYVIIYFCIILVLTVVNKIIAVVWRHYNIGLTKGWYLPPRPMGAWAQIDEIISFIILVSYLVPISLYVTLEFQKFFGKQFFDYDLDMYDERFDIRAKANTSDLNEELGQIEYLFSDKTGTLTENDMQFRQCMVAGERFIDVDGYLCRMSDAKTVSFDQDRQQTTTMTTMMNKNKPSERNRKINLSRNKTNVSFDVSAARSPPKPANQLNSEDNDAPKQKLVEHEIVLRPYSSTVTEFFIIWCLCHSVQLNRKNMAQTNASEAVNVYHNSTTSNTNEMRSREQRNRRSLRRKISFKGPLNSVVQLSKDGADYDYQASSPDEKAFLEAACRYGIIYHGVINDRVCISIHGENHFYRQLEMFDFDSTRKCMSVIVEFPDNTVRILCKGAESSMLPKASNSARCLSYDELMTQVNKYAAKGLRTLVFGTRTLSKSEAEQILHRVAVCRQSLENPEELVQNELSKIENKLDLLGCTGIEDRLQDGVPETIVSLRNAGIKIWVLTGDKEETAVNISYSSGHFESGMQEIRLTNIENLGKASEMLEKELERLAEENDLTVKYALVVNGSSLNHLLHDKVKLDFFDLCQEMNTVLCCRVSPLQKAEVVKMVKDNVKPEPITAAVGDGGNDVSMIIEAHVGLGIYGKEGRQAARASDYALGRFRFLRKALIVHGHTYYQRICTFINYFFYKNFVFAIPQFLYGFASLITSQILYNNVFTGLYNVTFTTLGIVCFGLFEQYLPTNHLYTRPTLYKKIAKNRMLSWNKFVEWNLYAIWHGFVIFAGWYLLMVGNILGDEAGMQDTITTEGKSYDHMAFGTMIFLQIWILVSVKLYLVTRTFNMAILIGFLVVFLGNIVLMVLMNLFPQIGFYYGISFIVDKPVFWLGIIVVTIISIIPDLVFKIRKDNEVKELLREPRAQRLRFKRRVHKLPTNVPAERMDEHRRFSVITQVHLQRYQNNLKRDEAIRSKHDSKDDYDDGYAETQNTQAQRYAMYTNKNYIQDEDNSRVLRKF